MTSDHANAQLRDKSLARDALTQNCAAKKFAPAGGAGGRLIRPREGIFAGFGSAADERDRPFLLNLFRMRGATAG